MGEPPAPWVPLPPWQSFVGVSPGSPAKRHNGREHSLDYGRCPRASPHSTPAPSAPRGGPGTDSRLILRRVPGSSAGCCG